MVKVILFWAAVVIVLLLGLRHILSIVFGASQEGLIKPGQRLCHLTSFLLLAGSAVAAVALDSWLLLPVGIILEYVFRHLVRGSGEQVTPKQQ